MMMIYDLGGQGSRVQDVHQYRRTAVELLLLLRESSALASMVAGPHKVQRQSTTAGFHHAE
jgi:hypothetical protein